MIKKLFQSLKDFHFLVIPVITVLLSIFIAIMPYKINHSFILIPLFTPMVIYFWSIYQPQNLPYIAVFFLGLFKDIMEDNSFGISAICLLFFQVMVRSQRKYIVNNGFIVVWAGFAFFLSVILFMPLIFHYFSFDVQIHEFTIVLSQWLITIFIYVPVHRLLGKLNNLSGLANE